MSTSSLPPPPPDSLTPSDEALWHAARDVHARRRAIGGFTLLAAVAAIIVALVLPNRYRASVRVLAPQQPMSSMLGALGRNISSAARLLGDNAGGDYARYFAILTSPGFLQATADTFGLTRVYDLQDARFPRDATLREMRKRITFELDPEYEFLNISVLDEDPERAARIANHLVAALNRENSRLSLATAGEYRSFIERRYQQANRAIDSLLDASKAFQEQYGVIDLPAQTQAFFEQAATLRTQVARLSIELEAMRAQYGPENPQVLALEEAQQAAQAEYNRALAGQEQSLPVPQSRLPTMVRQYAELERERQMQTAIMEVVAPMYETARLEETKQVEALQVIDPAHIPERKAEPKRTLLVLSATLSAFLLACVAAILAGAWRRMRDSVQKHLQAQA